MLPLNNDTPPPLFSHRGFPQRQRRKPHLLHEQRSAGSCILCAEASSGETLWCPSLSCRCGTLWVLESCQLQQPWLWPRGPGRCPGVMPRQRKGCSSTADPASQGVAHPPASSPGTLACKEGESSWTQGPKLCYPSPCLPVPQGAGQIAAWLTHTKPLKHRQLLAGKQRLSVLIHR